MQSSLRERFARLGPIRAVSRVQSGSLAEFVLSTRSKDGRSNDSQRLDAPPPDTVGGALALARRGVTLLKAKRAMERLLAHGRVTIVLPMVDDVAALSKELRELGIASRSTDPSPAPDIVALRKRLGMTREQFADTYGIELETLRNWEGNRRQMDATATAYLRAIENEPEAVEAAYAPSPGF